MPGRSWLLAVVALALASPATAQCPLTGELVLTGRVTSTDGTPLEEVLVGDRASACWALTDASGRFQVIPPPGVTVLSAEMIGFQRTWIELPTEASDTVYVDVVLETYGEVTRDWDRRYEKPPVFIEGDYPWIGCFWVGSRYRWNQPEILELKSDGTTNPLGGTFGSTVFGNPMDWTGPTDRRFIWRRNSRTELIEVGTLIGHSWVPAFEITAPASGDHDLSEIPVTIFPGARGRSISSFLTRVECPTA